MIRVIEGEGVMEVLNRVFSPHSTQSLQSAAFGEVKVWGSLGAYEVDHGASDQLAELEAQEVDDSRQDHESQPRDTAVLAQRDVVESLGDPGGDTLHGSLTRNTRFFRVHEAEVLGLQTHLRVRGRIFTVEGQDFDAVGTIIPRAELMLQAERPVEMREGGVLKTLNKNDGALGEGYRVLTARVMHAHVVSHAGVGEAMHDDTWNGRGFTSGDELHPVG